MSTFIQQLNDQLADISAAVLHSLVQVGNGRRQGTGAGTIWHPDGLILTNAHVVHSRHPEVTLPDGRTLPAAILARDAERDLAALSIRAMNLPTIELGSARRLRSGDWVLALGHPWGVLGAATAGAVIAVGRPPEVARYPGDLIQVGLTLRPGHSGGPMVDTRGRLVGINTMISGPEVGLAIPLHTVKRFLKENLGTPEAAPAPPSEYI